MGLPCALGPVSLLQGFCTHWYNPRELDHLWLVGIVTPLDRQGTAEGRLSCCLSLLWAPRHPQTVLDLKFFPACAAPGQQGANPAWSRAVFRQTADSLLNASAQNQNLSLKSTGTLLISPSSKLPVPAPHSDIPERKKRWQRFAAMFHQLRLPGNASYANHPFI